MSVDNPNYELDASNYLISGCSIIPISISPDLLEIFGTTKEYDGTTSVPNDFVVSAQNFAIDGDIISVNYNASYNSKNVNEANIITLTDLQLDNSNYVLERSTKDVNATILPKEIEKPTCSRKVYTGNPITLLENTDEFTVSSNGIATNAGTYNVTVMTNSNYTFEDNKKEVEVSCLVDPIELDVNNITYQNTTKEYDGTTSVPSNFELSISTGVVANDTVNIDYESALYNSVNVADADSIIVTGITLDNSNYKLNSDTITLTNASIIKTNSICSFDEFDSIDYPRTTNTTITYHCTGDGEVTLSSQSDIIEVLNYNNTSADILIKNSGSADLTLTLSETANYNSTNISTEINIDSSKFIVTLVSYGGTIPSTEIEVPYNDVYNNLPIPEKEGYTFNGWYIGNSHTVSVVPSTVIYKDETLYASWFPNSYWVTFYTFCDQTISPIYHKMGTVLIIPSITNNGATLEGWYLDEGYTQRFNPNKIPARNIKLYAKWVYNVDSEVSSAINSFNSESLEVEKIGDQINVYFTDDEASLIDLGTGLTKFLNKFKSNPILKSIMISYNGRGVDYIHPDDGSGSGTLLIMARFVGWVTSGLWSGSAGVDATVDDLVGKTIDLDVILIDDVYTSGTNKTSENYKINLMKRTNN